ncbi:MAG: hypothetical protein WBA41_17665, partial [Rivularia sp. (in: cyanobacteria)]
ANSQTTANLYNGMGIPFKKTLICYLIAKLSWHDNLLKLQTAISYFSQASNEINYLVFRGYATGYTSNKIRLLKY